MGCERRGQSPADMGDHLGRWGALTRAASLPITWSRLDDALVEGGRLQPVRKAPQCLLRIRFTGKRRATQLLQGLGCGLALLEPVFIDAPLGREAAMGRGAQHPALGHATVVASPHASDRFPKQ